MHEAAAREVWQMLGPERERLVALAESGPPPMFASISGAHLYGFASPDSDVDLRGAFVRPARELLGLFPAAETLSRTLDHDGIEVDWVAHDVRKFATWPTAWTPASVRPDPITVAAVPAISWTARSSSPWTVGLPSCTCQP